MAGAKKPQTPYLPLRITPDGIDRSKVYTREEICRRFGYDVGAGSVSQTREIKRNADRFFREHFLTVVRPKAA